MTEEEFTDIFADSIGAVADRRYPKNETAAHGGAATPGRGEFLRDAAILCADVTASLIDVGFIEVETDPVQGQISDAFDLVTGRMGTETYQQRKEIRGRPS